MGRPPTSVQKESVRECLFFFFFGGGGVSHPFPRSPPSPRAAVHPHSNLHLPTPSPPPRTHTHERTNETKRNNATKHHCPTAYTGLHYIPVFHAFLSEGTIPSPLSAFIIRPRVCIDHKTYIPLLPPSCLACSCSPPSASPPRPLFAKRPNEPINRHPPTFQPSTFRFDHADEGASPGAVQAGAEGLLRVRQGEDD